MRPLSDEEELEGRQSLEVADYQKSFNRVETEHRPSPDQLIERDLTARMPYRDLTGAILGDPKIGQSALDKKIKQAAKEKSDDLQRLRQPALLQPV